MTDVPMRTQGREFALRLLYAQDVSGGLYPADDEVPGAGWWKPDDDLDLVPAAVRFGHRLWRGVCEHRDVLDEEIKASASNWRIDRMTSVDRNLIRIGVYELTRCDDIPLQVTLSELIDLAKHYGDDEAGGFVNGVLDAVAHRPQSSHGAE